MISDTCRRTTTLVSAKLPVMEHLDMDDLKKAFESLQDITECPVCLQSLRPETVMCVNGHVICKGCQSGQKVCPTCKKDFANVQEMTFVKKVLQVVPRQCRYDPCIEVVKTGSDHENFCKFRPTKCKVPICQWEGPCGDLYQHYSLVHLKKEVVVDENEGSITSFILEPVGVRVGVYVWIKISQKNEEDITVSFIPLFTDKPKFKFINAKFTYESFSLRMKMTFETVINVEEESWEFSDIFISPSIIHRYDVNGDLKANGPNFEILS